MGNLGGGLVAGDQLRVDVRVGAGACAFIGSQASTKVYQNPEDRPCGSTTRASVEQGGLLVFAPDPVQAFAGANYAQDQEFRLAADSGLVLLDWFTAGRAACGERWAFNRFHSRNGIWCAAADPGSTPHFLDSLHLDADDRPLIAPHRLGRLNCMALLVFVGTRVRDAAVRMLDQVAALPVSPRAPLICSASPLKNGALLRVAGEEVSTVSAELRRYLSVLEPLLGDNPWARRV
jgi:urease accessory protein